MTGPQVLPSTGRATGRTFGGVSAQCRGLWTFALGGAISFLYFRVWALCALDIAEVSWRKWALGLVHDLTALGVFLALARASLGRVHSALVRSVAVALVFLNWGNFELREHVGQPFLPQILGVIPLEEATTRYGMSLIWGLLHPRDIALCFLLPATLVVAARLDAPAVPLRTCAKPLALTLALGTAAVAGMRAVCPNVTGFPRTLTWCFYRHGGPEWLAYFLDDDDVVIGDYDVSALAAVERSRLQDILETRRGRSTQPSDGRSHPDRLVALPSPQRRKNLVMIHLESFRGASFDGLGDVWTGITPRLSNLMREGAYFTRAFTNAIPSDRSITSMFCSVLVPDSSLAKMHRPRPRLKCLPDLLSDVGYRSARMTGIPESFQRLGEFFTSHGVRESYGSHELDQTFPHPRHGRLPSSGYDPKHRYDERLFHAARSWLADHAKTDERPFFLALETMTNHLPWKLPENAEHPLHQVHAMKVGAGDTGTDETTLMHRTMRLTDAYVADFIEWLRQLDSGKVMEETIVVVYSDHPPWFAEPDFTRYDTTIKESWIPLFFLGVPPELKGQRDYPVSLLDVAPTLVELLGLSDDHAFVGAPLFDADHPRWFTFSRPGDGRIFFADGEDLTFQNGQRFRLKGDMRLEPLPAASPSTIDDWFLLERFLMRRVAIERELLSEHLRPLGTPFTSR